MLGLEILDAGHRLIEGAGGDDAHQIGYLDGCVGGLGPLIREAEQGEGGRRGLRLPLRLDGGQLDLLHLAGAITRLVTQHDDRENGGQPKARGDGKGAQGEAHLHAAQQIPAAHPHHEQGGGYIARRHRVHELDLGHRVEDHRGHVHQLHALGHQVELGAHRVLHPAVADQDPERGEVGTERHQHGHQQMLTAGELVPAEEEESHQGRLEEEGHQPLHRQRGAENVPHILGVVGPVGAELELQGDACGHPHHEVDAKQLAPETGDVLVDHLAGHHIGRLCDHQDPGQPQREGHKQEVEHGRGAKLQARQADHVIRIDHASLSFVVFTLHVLCETSTPRSMTPITDAVILNYTYNSYCITCPFTVSWPTACNSRLKPGCGNPASASPPSARAARPMA